MRVLGCLPMIMTTLGSPSLMGPLLMDQQLVDMLCLLVYASLRLIYRIQSATPESMRFFLCLFYNGYPLPKIERKA
jgi:hypothetical protein